MRILDRSWLTALAAATLVFTAYSQQSADSANDTPYKVPRTSWGDPDLSGIWPGTAMVGVPMQRDEKLGLRNWLTEEEFTAREAQFARQDELDNADFELENAATTPGGAVGGPVSPPPHWLERGDPQRQASLIVDPPNGRMPPMTEAGQARQAARARSAPGPRPRGFVHGSQPLRPLHHARHGRLADARDLQRRQPDRAVAGLRRDHERDDPRGARHPARRPPAALSPAIKQWVGDSRGHFDGDTLVVETTNFTDRTNVGQARHSDKLKITERYTRVDDDTLVLRLTVEDPETWTAPWTLELPLQRDDSYGMFEYACHEGNLAMFNILSGHRADERAAAGRR